MSLLNKSKEKKSKTGLIISLTLCIIYLLGHLAMSSEAGENSISLIYVSFMLSGGPIALFIRSFRPLKLGQGVAAFLGGTFAGAAGLAFYIAGNIFGTICNLIWAIFFLWLGFKKAKQLSKKDTVYRCINCNYRVKEENFMQDTLFCPECGDRLEVGTV